jgi:hypothetical protein
MVARCLVRWQRWEKMSRDLLGRSIYWERRLYGREATSRSQSQTGSEFKAEFVVNFS